MMTESQPEYGPGFIGLIIGAVMFGMTVLQCNSYFHNFQQDRLYLKACVATLCCLDALHLIFSAHMMYFYIITNFGNMAAANQNIWSLKGLAVVQVIVILTVQTLYLMRIWKLSRTIVTQHTWISSTLLAGLFILCVLAFGIGILFTYEVGTLEAATSVASFRWAILVAFSTTVFIDICIAAIMSTLLYRSRPGVKRTDSMLFTLIQYIIGTGVLTSVASIVYVVLYVIKPDTFLYLAQEFSITRLYVNSFMAMMNARDGLRERLSVPMELDINFSNALQFPSPSTSAASPMEVTIKRYNESFVTAFETPVAHPQSQSSADITEIHENVTAAPGLNV
ncbi:hypothetical protein FIBSPDRAFT_1036317 [Athelia psychrophila]|uniref:DUF6534 domain-containing protein n=1 Tax=Athelia psychrophila TaxID=1759441 RepID=A0A166VYN7_9AGAM|nr:hypothetical protein FIBSPDRAFT_1036317 [Fibularhizoctonia sp. CBS 109695]